MKESPRNFPTRPHRTAQSCRSGGRARKDTTLRWTHARRSAVDSGVVVVVAAVAPLQACVRVDSAPSESVRVDACSDADRAVSLRRCDERVCARARAGQCSACSASGQCSASEASEARCNSAWQLRCLRLLLTSTAPPILSTPNLHQRCPHHMHSPTPEHPTAACVHGCPFRASGIQSVGLPAWGSGCKVCRTTSVSTAAVYGSTASHP